MTNHIKLVVFTIFASLSLAACGESASSSSVEVFDTETGKTETYHYVSNKCSDIKKYPTLVCSVCGDGYDYSKLRGHTFEPFDWFVEVNNLPTDTKPTMSCKVGYIYVTDINKFAVN